MVGSNQDSNEEKVLIIVYNDEAICCVVFASGIREDTEAAL
jgi:hypothetical protein